MFTGYVILGLFLAVCALFWAVVQLMGELNHYRELALTHPLTGVPNRRGFAILVDHAIASIRREEVTYGKKINFIIVMVDLDDFKTVNDTLGHEAGDEALKIFTTEADSHLRGSDIISHFGGDEFVLFLMGVTKEKAQKVLSLLRAKYEKKTDELFARAGKVRPPTVTLSFGLEEKRTSEECWRELLSRADRDMYAKKNGRRETLELLPM